MIVVMGDDNFELLRQLIENETINRQLAEQDEYLDVPDQGDAYDTEDDLVDDEDLRLIVQVRTSDETEMAVGLVMQKWVDANIDPQDLDTYREQFPGSEYRLVAVYDEIVNGDDSFEQQEVNSEDEIGQLKAEVLKLKAELANLYAIANTVTGR